MIWKRLFKKKAKEQDKNTSLTPEYIENLPAVDDATFYRDSKRLLQRFDEYITSAEAESESLSIELDACLEQQDDIKDQLVYLNKPNSWHERHFLLKLDRLQLHSENLMQRIEIYSQNIKIYLNLISKIQDVKAMRMNGLDEEKIETIWVEFQQALDQYRDRVITESSGFHSEAVTTNELENRIGKLTKVIFPGRDNKDTASRKSIEELIECSKKQKESTSEEEETKEKESKSELDALLE